MRSNRSALGHATRWEDHTFEIVHEEAQSPAMHMALDEALAEAVGAGTRAPTLRIWEWGAPAVVIGSFQSLRNEVDPDGGAAERELCEAVEDEDAGLLEIDDVAVEDVAVEGLLGEQRERRLVRREREHEHDQPEQRDPDQREELGS